MVPLPTFLVELVVWVVVAVPSLPLAVLQVVLLLLLDILHLWEILRLQEILRLWGILCLGTIFEVDCLVEGGWVVILVVVLVRCLVDLLCRVWWLSSLLLHRLRC